MTNYLLFIFLALPVSLYAQKKNKGDGIEFCGWKMINRLFTTNGFSTGEKKLISRKRNFDVMMIRFIKPQG